MSRDLMWIVIIGLLGAGAAHAEVFSKTETIEYHDNTASWVLGQVKRATTNGIETSRTDFWPGTSLPQKTWAFGKPQQYFVYHTDGTLFTVTDGNSNTTTLSNWKRGIPQAILFPATADQPSGTRQSAVVNGQGWIDSVTDENGYTTSYYYDEMGRTNRIVHPTGDSNAWHETTITFGPASAIYGLPEGHWRQTVTTGNARTITFFDALWRPVVEEKRDMANPNATLAQTVTRYDADGRPTFASYAQRSGDPAIYNTWGNPALSPNASGVRTFYDVLGRVSQIDQDSEQGVVTTTKSYDQIRTYTTNPRNFETIVGHIMYDQPTHDLPRGIIAPEGASTEIYYNTLDQPTALRRRNVGASVDAWRHYHYDGFQQLCRVTEPETGATVMGYDGAGNVVWSAAGLAAGTPCDGANQEVIARKANRTYDARNRLKTLSFPDNLGDQTWVYTPDGLVDSIRTHNGGGIEAINRYAYNRRRLLIGESVEQPGWYVWGSGYNYDNHGSLASQSFHPTAHTVTYAPNALGQPTRAGGYATEALYYPNGALQQFTYGNGIVHSMLQNERQLPSWVADGSSTHFSYNYDANGNVTQITDYAHLQGGRQTRSMTYDGLDRLRTAASPMFNGTVASYSYDVLDNLTRVVAPGRDHYYCYDHSWRLTNVKAGSCDGTSVVGLGYDVQGNLRNKNGQVYYFDYGNRLRQVGDYVEGYRYDGHGRRILAWTPALGSILSQYSNSGQLAFQLDERQSKYIDYVYLQGSLVAQREQNYATGVSSTKYHHTDALGTPVAVTDQSGNVLERSEYEPYGKLLNRPPTNGPGFTAHVLDAATGMNYMQQRYYDPQIGRFLSVDPVTADSSTGGNFNRYWYGNNNPYRFIDPDGRQACCNEGPVRSFAEFRDRIWGSMSGGAMQTTGQAIAAEVAFVVGVATDNQALRDVAIEGMRENVSNSDGVSAATMGVGPRAGKGTGSYTNTHQSAMKYHGKGSEARMHASANSKAKANNDPVINKEHKPAVNSREAFKDEARRIQADGGPGNGNYNKIESPGKKYSEEDG